MKQQGAKRLIETARKNLEKFLEIIIFCEKKSREIFAKDNDLVWQTKLVDSQLSISA